MAKLLFIQNIEYEFLGPMYIAASARAHGHQVRLSLGDRFADFTAAIEEFQPDLFAFSIMTGSHLWAREMAAELKRHYGKRSIFGGAHPTFFPEFIHEDGVELLVRGEGEEAMVEVLDHIDAGTDYSAVGNLSSKSSDGRVISNPVRNLRRSLDDYAFPDRNLYHALSGKIDRGVCNVITSRGCPFHCTFCFEDSMRELYDGKGKYVRIREIEHVLAELKQIKSSREVRTIYFADDVFGMSRKWLYEFLERYRAEIGLPFICLLRADIVAADPEYARRLAAGGCATVFFGIETGNEKTRNEILKKNLSNDEIRLAAKRLHEVGIRFRTYNIVGLPGENLDDALATLNFNIEIGADYPWCSVFMPFPGTELTRIAFERGYLPAEFEFNSLSKSFFTDSPLRIPDIDRITNLQKFFQTAVLAPWSLPLIRQLIKLPPNRLFDAWFGFIYFIVYLRSEKKRFFETLIFALRNFRHLLARE